MSVAVDEDRLDSVAAIEELDPSGMLRAVASSAAQVRDSATRAAEAGLERLAAEGRPRAFVVTGMGGSGVSGDVLAAVAGMTSPVPVVVHRGYDLPGWIGPADLVAAVSCSGTTEETLSATDEAIRRGCRLLGVGAADSPLQQRIESARGVFVPVVSRLSPRSSLWALATPLVVAADRLGLARMPDEAFEATAARLESIAEACRPDRESFVNPGKSLAVELAASLPVLWGSGAVGPVAAYRAACQLAENAKYPAVSGALPEANHNQVVALDGPLAGASSDDDIFRDRVEDEAALRMRLVLVRDSHEHAQVARRADVSAEVAQARGVPVTVLTAEGTAAYERLASLVGLIDYASVYLAVLYGLDPTPIGPIDELKERIR